MTWLDYGEIILLYYSWCESEHLEVQQKEGPKGGSQGEEMCQRDSGWCVLQCTTLFTCATINPPCIHTPHT